MRDFDIGIVLQRVIQSNNPCRLDITYPVNIRPLGARPASSACNIVPDKAIIYSVYHATMPLSFRWAGRALTDGMRKVSNISEERDDIKAS